jgi:hypothetical protein
MATTDAITVRQKTPVGRRRPVRRRAARARYDAVVGLGAACQVAEQCRRQLGFTPGVPFDWMITPFAAIEAILADMGAGLGKRFVSVRGGTSTQCANYGLLYEHEFERDAEGRVIFDADAIANCRSRMVHKMQKLADILGSRKRVLFIRAYSSTGLAGDRFNDATFTVEALNQLVDLIQHRAPDLAFDLLFIHSPDRATEKVDLSGRLSPRVIVRAMAHPPDMEWYGIDADWVALFRELGLTKSAPDECSPAFSPQAKSSSPVASQTRPVTGATREVDLVAEASGLSSDDPAPFEVVVGP